MNNVEKLAAQIISDEVLNDIASLSSGTFGSLTKYRKYSDLDKVQTTFYSWAKKSKKSYRTWALAWKDFEKSNAYKDLVEKIEK